MSIKCFINHLFTSGFKTEIDGNSTYSYFNWLKTDFFWMSRRFNSTIFKTKMWYSMTAEHPERNQIAWWLLMLLFLIKKKKSLLTESAWRWVAMGLKLLVSGRVAIFGKLTGWQLIHCQKDSSVWKFYFAAS